MAARQYKNKAGKRVKGVTTILGNLGWNAMALKLWAYKMGTQGLDIHKASNIACDAGTLAHHLIESYYKKTEPDLSFYKDSPEIIHLAQQAFANFLEWSAMMKLEPLYSEQELVSEEFQFGGTIDHIAKILGKIAIIDWKSSNHIYSEYLIQVSAYQKLWDENHPDEPITGGAYLLRISKETADFAFYKWADLSKAWEVFKHLLEIDKLKEDLKDML